MQSLLPGLTRHNLARELLAGVTLLAIAVPLNIGYAQIAGLPPTAGLYALILPTVVYVLLTSSRQVVASPDAAAAALVFSSLTGLGVGGDDFIAMAGAQAILCGLFLGLTSVLKLGFLANFLSKPILVGFVAGLALEVLLSQVAKMLGIKFPADLEFFPKLVELIRNLSHTSAASVIMAALSLLALVAFRKYLPTLPGALIVLVAATLFTVWLGLESRGVSVLGEVQSGPPQFAFPQVGWAQWLALVPSALALALIAMAEGVLVSRSYATQRGYQVDSDRDLLAFGAANVASGLSMSFSVGSSTSRTAAMDQLGSRTQLPSLVMAAGAFVLLLVGTDVLAQIPSPAIGAVVAMAVLGLLGISEFKEIKSLSTYEFAIAVACLLGVLVLGPLRGLFLAFILALINLARRAASPEVDVLISGNSTDPTTSTSTNTSHADTSTTTPGFHSAPVLADPAANSSTADVAVLRFAAPLFFANGQVFTDRVAQLIAQRDPQLRALVLDMEAITDIDVTGAESLTQALDALAAANVQLAVARLRPGLRARLTKFGLLTDVPEFPTNREALIALRQPESSSTAN
ncbi:SulP family inorganic anion transporter [Timonella senegalensis]|uniref:SulP family inorganic anion transporter n=1 Tax=Timonella senegalensis TaxID=1465825 RepID=UPI0002F18B1D|nr:SulP family inorganic anion transporter [Timonella senegalensis]